MTHNRPTVIKDQANGDTAADTYHNYRRDVEMIRELGLDVYRFSLSWSRILPTGRSNYISKSGIKFYNNYINEASRYIYRYIFKSNATHTNTSLTLCD